MHRILASCVSLCVAMGCGGSERPCGNVSAETLEACSVACDEGDAEVCARIGVAYERGELGAAAVPDLAAARSYFERACAHAADAQWWMCVLAPSIADDRDREASARTLERLCADGSLLACHELARPVAIAPSIPIDLPAPADEVPTTSMSIAILPDGSLLLDAAPTTIDAIRAMTPPAATRAVIAADRSTPHGRVVEVIDALRAAGVTRYAINVAPDGSP